MNDLINRQEAVDILELGAEILRRVLDDMDVVGIDREKYSYGLKLIESNIEDIKELPSAQPELDIWNDGTLHISVSKGQLDKIGRVLVEENGTIFCKLFYQDAEPERKTGRWILDRSGAYCCSKCMEPCASYAMMRPRDKYCKMCGSRNEVTE